ncbi:DUF3320 domain-containing protein [Arthrobacter sp. KBS0703]|uniref:DUF3320 domain-containing protein n=1 Tax=Arthrobacter sp. KBS0703 TaxID=1955698 RepID=UPI001116CA98|nr:DUF3320 domain-containing protein [Arthrobacter sp. KBS0703]TSE16656.1 DUF3320 domain-containing protein [Arthrobacter sp. KBS0703]
MSLSNREYVGRALEALAVGLEPYIAAVLAEVAPGVAWTKIIQHKDENAGRAAQSYAPTDLSLQLRIMTESMGSLGYPFNLPHDARSHTSELRQARNRWAHNETFDDADTFRALDTAGRLAKVLGMDQTQSELVALLTEYQNRASPKEQTEEDQQALPAAVAQTDHPEESFPGEPAVHGPAISAAHVVVEVITADSLSYAMAHNGFRFVRQVKITNNGAEIRGAVVQVEASAQTGRISGDFQQYVDLAAGQTITLDDLNVPVQATTMYELADRQMGKVLVTVHSAGADAAVAELGRAEADLTLLPAQLWIAGRGLVSYEFLAAYVQPHHPSIAKLMSEAADILVQTTGSGSFDGYLEDGDRVDQIVFAIAQAMSARDIRYSMPPASWGLEGQQVRTPAQVLDDRLGTCLDTTLVLAAALEFCGIRPLLWLVEGHAFLGYWREEGSLSTAASDDVPELVSLVQRGFISLVETTLLTGSQPISAAALRSSPLNRYVESGNDEINAVTDVRRARLDGIYPLPARTTSDAGTHIVVNYVPETRTAPALPQKAPSSGGASRTASDVPPRVLQWKNALLDLSLRNRLINFTETARFPLAVPTAWMGAFEDLISKGTSVSLIPSNQISAIHQERGIRFGRDLPQDELADLLSSKKAVFAEVSEDGYSAKMRGLAYKAKTQLEETGANNLYLAIGSLMWELDGRALRSPLVLVPVKLTSAGKNGLYRVTLDETGQSTPNYCLLEKLAQSHDLRIPGLAEPEEDGSGIDLDAAFAAVRAAVSAKGLAFRVENTVDLSMLQFAKFRLWKDLDENWKEFTANSLVKHLISTPTELYSDNVPVTPDVDLDALAAQCPIPADSSQLEAVASAVAGQTFVLEGPPGTGKSQTITNLLTRAIADGKRVLFVAEKRAALDVVQRRLDDVGMGPFSLDLHDKGSKPAVVRAQIKHALELRLSANKQQLETASTDLASARRGLVRYANNVHEENGAQLSLYSARTKALTYEPDHATVPLSPELTASLNDSTLSSIRQVFRELPEFTDPVRPGPDHPWRFVSVAGGDQQEQQLLAAGRRLNEALNALRPTPGLPPVLDAAQTPADVVTLATLLQDRNVPLGTLDVVRSGDWSVNAEQLEKLVTAFASVQHPGLEHVAPGAMDLPLPEILGRAQQAAASGFWGRKKRLLAVAAELSPVLVSGAEIRHKELVPLLEKLVAVQHEVSGLRATRGSLPGLPADQQWNPLKPDAQADLRHRISWLRWAAQAVQPSPEPDAVSFQTELRTFLKDAPDVHQNVIGWLRELSHAWEEFLKIQGVGSDDLRAWTSERGFLAQWWETSVPRRLDAAGSVPLTRWLELIRHVEPLRTAGLVDARIAILDGELEADDAAAAFERGLAEGSLAERRIATGLSDFDTIVHERTIERFTSRAETVRELLKTNLAAEVLHSRTVSSSSTSGRMGELQRQLTRQRGGMSVRKLMEHYADLITGIMPCTLVSPDSVARFFPAKAGLFDIVVFDEASQIRVADAVGAMGRGASVVVVGDSKQMPPTSFAEISSDSGTDGDAEISVVEDMESILSECVEARVPRQWLSWHYRSQDESLIAFSNQQYYDSKLSSFPGPSHGAANAGVRGHGVNFVRVVGQFNRSGPSKVLRTNPVEAAAVVAEIRHRFDADPAGTPSVGVVTFNLQQRALIEGLLRDTEDPRIVGALDEDSEGLFVKNLENVQGDERDVILFSTGFSKNDKGYLPLNFGPLNRSGGERRLNVAVTRARRQVIVFSSFNPADLRSEETSSVGIKHLRSYLDLAEQGTAALPYDGRRAASIDLHREEIADALRDRGFVVATDVGLSDFKVDISVAVPDNPNRPLMAVLLDSPAWAARRTAGDRDGLPGDVLTRMMRWPSVQRVWLPAWLADRDAVLDKLEAALEEAYEAAAPASEPQDALTGGTPAVTRSGRRAAEAAAPEQEFVLVAGKDTSPLGPGTLLEASQANPRPATLVTAYAQSSYEPWTVRRFGGLEVLDTLRSRRSVTAVREAIQDVIAAEGPIHQERLAKLVCAAFELNKVNSQRANSVLDALDESLHYCDADGFSWDASVDREMWEQFRPNSADITRKPEHISVVEIRNAMVDIVRLSGGIAVDELHRETIRTFGGKRLTAGVTARLNEGLQYGVDTKRLELRGAFVQLAS